MKYQVVRAEKSPDNENKMTISAIIVDDPEWIYFIFTFKDIVFDFKDETSEMGVSYETEIEYKGQGNKEVDEEVIHNVSKELLSHIIEDFVKTITDNLKDE